MGVFPTIGRTTERPSSTDNGKVIYTHSVTTTEYLMRVGTFQTEWEFTVEK